jgi:hypothetical protein
MGALKKLWQQEPVLVTTLLPLLTTIGVLTATQQSAIDTVVAAAVQVAAAFGIRARVSPAALKPAPKDAGVTWLEIAIVVTLVGVLILLFYGRLR